MTPINNNQMSEKKQLKEELEKMSNVLDVPVSFGNGTKRYITIGLNELLTLINHEREVAYGNGCEVGRKEEHELAMETITELNDQIKYLEKKQYE